MMAKRRKSSSMVLVLAVLVCCYQTTCAGVVAKQANTKNSTNLAKDVTTTTSTTTTTKHPKVVHKSKTATTTTTSKPVVETVKPFEVDYDARSAFINNQYVADPDPPIIHNAPPSPLYDILQQQMQSVLSNTANNLQIYSDLPQMKEIMSGEDMGNGGQKPPGKPLFSFDMHEFDEYDEEDTGTEDNTDPDEQPENCEDTEESLTENDDATGYGGVPPQISIPNPGLLQNNYGQSPQTSQLKPTLDNPKNPKKGPYNSSHYATPVHTKQESSNNGQKNKPVPNSPSSAYGSQSDPTDYQQAIHKPPQYNSGETNPKPIYEKPQQSTNGQSKPLNQVQTVPKNDYASPKPLEHNSSLNQKPSNSNEKPKTQQSQKPHRYSSKAPLNLAKPLTTPLKTPSSSQNIQPLIKPNDSKTEAAQNYNKLINNGNSIIPSPTNVAYGNSNPLISSNSNIIQASSTNPSYGITSPTFSPTSSLSFPNTSYGGSSNASPLLPLNMLFGNPNFISSSPFSSTSANNKVPNNDSRRHLTFRTVSSSTQYVSTPLAELVLKFSVGMAKHPNSENTNSNINQGQMYNMNDIEK